MKGWIGVVCDGCHVERIPYNKCEGKGKEEDLERAG